MTIDRRVAAAVLLGAGCSSPSPSCGPDSDAGALSAAGSGISASYADFIAGANNDCPDPDAPVGVVSLTLTGQQSGSAGLATFCIPRPDELESAPQLLASSLDVRGVEVIDLSGAAGSCTFALDPAQQITGTVTAHGLCGEGNAGFSLDFAGSVGVTRTCGSATDRGSLALSGDTLVTE